MYYEESMVLLTVDGDTDDEYDRYLNGIGALHLKHLYSCFQQTVRESYSLFTICTTSSSASTWSRPTRCG